MNAARAGNPSNAGILIPVGVVSIPSQFAFCFKPVVHIAAIAAAAAQIQLIRAFGDPIAIEVGGRGIADRLRTDYILLLAINNADVPFSFP